MSSETSSGKISDAIRSLFERSGTGDFVVERNEELDSLRTAFTDCVAGKGRVALISGGLASGKTELLQTFTEHAATNGALVLTATGAREESGLRMGVAWQLFRSAALPPGVLDRVSRLVVAEPPRSQEDDMDPGPLQLADGRAVRGLCEVLLDLAKRSPVVLAIDDLQFVDKATLHVLLYLRRRIRAERLMLVLTEWHRPSLARPFLAAEVSRQPDVRSELELLSESGVAQLAAERLGAKRANVLAPVLHAMSGGSPALARALAEDCERLDADARTPVAGGAYRRAVVDCLHRWDLNLQRVASGFALLGEHADTELVAELLGMASQPVSQLLEVLTGAGIADGERLQHEEIAETVVAGLPPDEASELHVRTAELLDKYGLDVQEAARHLVAADAVPGPWAVRVLRQAVDQYAAEDSARAVKCLELAMRAVEDEQDLLAVRATLVRVAWRVNPSVAARHLPALRCALAAGHLGWRDAIPVIRHALWHGELHTATEQLRIMTETAGQMDARTTAELRLTVEWIFDSLREQVPEDIRTLLTSTDRTTSPNPWVQTGRLTNSWVRGAGREVATCAEHILQDCHGDMLPEVGAIALLALEHTDRQERAQHWAALLADRATTRNATVWQAILGCVAADLGLRRGDLVAAKAKANAALELLPAQSWGVLIGYPLSTLVLVHTAMGDLDEAAAVLDRPVPEAMTATAFGQRYLHARGHFNLAAGRTMAALEDFERCACWARAREQDAPAAMPWRRDLAETLLRLGRTREAQAFAAAQLAKGGANGGLRGRGIALRVFAACAKKMEKVGLLRDAVQYLERCGDRLELAKALADLGAVHQELGQLASARSVLRKAEQLARACQADVLTTEEAQLPSERQPRESASEDEPSGGIATLSDAERKVAELAAYGYANREIGRKLYITVSTVEQHLTRVYRKLNVARRTDLLAKLERYEKPCEAPQEATRRG